MSETKGPLKSITFPGLGTYEIPATAEEIEVANSENFDNTDSNVQAILEYLNNKAQVQIITWEADD